MNKVLLIGRLVNAPEVKYISDNVCVVNGCIAVQREFKNEDKEADFINYVAFKSTAELIGRYLLKGNKVFFEGRWQHRSYKANNGETRYVDEMVVKRVEFLEKADSSSNNEAKSKVIDDKTPIANDNDELPF